jgi:aminoglycoside phosphotransferase (APT) family kinase protein
VPRPLDESLARDLVARQFPRWAALPVTRVLPGGIDNRTFRLGDELAIRLPSAAGYAASVAKEQRWLPVIARTVPLPVPEPVAHGEPDDDFPYPWSVNRWLPGEPALTAAVPDRHRFARDLAAFLRALQTVPTDGAPAAGAHSFHRGADPVFYDDETRRAIAALGDRIDGAAATRVWEDGLAATWTGEPVWFHGDVSVGNLLVTAGVLSAVIDFGTSGVGDPSCDLYIAWTYLGPAARAAFRAELGPDDAMWARGRAWTLWKALISLADPSGRGAWAQPVLDAVLEDARG